MNKYIPDYLEEIVKQLKELNKEIKKMNSNALDTEVKKTRHSKEKE